MLASATPWGHAGSTYYWDPDGNAANNVFATQAGLGGAGTWGTGATWWDRSLPTLPDFAWSNSSNDTAVFGGLASGTVTLSGQQTAGGLVFLTNNYAIATSGTNILRLDNGLATPVLINGFANATLGSNSVAGISGSDGLIKAGGGTLTVQGNNTSFGGPVILNGGTLTSSGSVSALGSDTITLNFGTFRLLNNGTASNTVAAIAYSNNIIAQGNVTLNVDRVSANTNNTISIPTLTVGSSTLTITNGDGYGFQVTGKTTLGGALSTFSTTMTPVGPSSADPTAGMVALSGDVTGAGILNKIGAGTVVLQAANDYSGGTNIVAGTLLLDTAAATLGSGEIIVNPGAALAIENGKNVALANGQVLALAGSGSSLAVLRFDADLDHTANGSSLSSAVVSPYGAAVQINTGFVNYNATGTPGAAATFTNNIDLSKIGSTAAGNGPVYLGGSTTSTVSGKIKAAADDVLRLGGGGTLNLNAANQLSALNDAATTLVVGSPISNVQTITNGTGTVAIQNTNALQGTITINKGSTIQVSGTAAATQTPLGTGTINLLSGTLDTTASNYVGASPQLGNTTFNLFEGGTLTLNNTATTVNTTDLRISNTSTLNMRSGTLNFLGSNTAGMTSSQTVAAINARGGNVINIVPGSGANAAAIFTATALNRPGLGGIAFTHGTAALGSATTQFYISNFNGTGVAPAPVNGMIAPWMVDGTTVAAPTFLTYGATGLAPAVFSASKLGTSTASTIVNQDATAFSATNGAAYALRLTTGVMSGTVTISGNATDGAGLILAGAATHTGNFNFGTAGANEAEIYVTADTTISGTLAATGLTKFGPNVLVLSGSNSNLTGPLVVDGGTLRGTNTGFNFQQIILNGDPRNNAVSIADFTTANAIYLNDVVVKDDGTITGTAGQQRIQSITVNQREGGSPTSVLSTDPITLNIAIGLNVQGSTTLSGDVNWNNSSGSTQVLLTGPVTGAGAFNKYGNGQTLLLNDNNNYSGGTVIYGTGASTGSAVLRSQAGTDAATPFGTGSVTVQPGGILGMSNPKNTLNNPVTVNSDLSGLATISLVYSGSAGLPQGSYTFNNGSLAGPFSTVLAIDAVGFSSAVNQNTYAGGTSFLGTTIGGNFTGAITPSSVNTLVPDTNGGLPLTSLHPVYRLGGGTGSLNLMGATNQLTGASDVMIGAISNVTQASSVGLVNGSGNVFIYNSNNLSGNVYLNTGGNLALGQDGALGSATIVFNGGGLLSDLNSGTPFLAPVRTISNPIAFAGDAQFTGATNLNITSNFGLGDNQTGVTRTFFVQNQFVSGNPVTSLLTLSGNISDGVNGSLNGITKTGTGPLYFTGANTYSGYTNLNAGTVVVNSDSSISPNSQITFNGGSLGVWNSSFTTNRNYIFVGSGVFDVGAAQTLTQGLGSNFNGGGLIQKSGFGTMILKGVNSNNGGNAWQLNAGILQISADVNLGDPVTKGQIVANGGVLRVDGTFSSARNILPNTNATTSIGIDVTSGNTFTSTGLLNNNGTGVFTVVKTGPGTFINDNAANSEKILIVNNGIFESASNLPFAAASTVALNGGTLYLDKTTAGNQSVANTTGTMTFGGGGYLTLEAIATNSSEIKPLNLLRVGTGTLVISNVTNVLGQAGNGGVRVMPQTDIFGIGIGLATANQNGILAPSLLTADSTGKAQFAFYNSATTGIAPYAGTTVASLAGTQPTAIGDISTPQNLTGTNSIYAFRTTSDVNGGTLVIPSVNTVQQGGIVVNASATIGSNLVFDPTSTGTIPLAAAATTANSNIVTVTNTAGLLPGMPVSGPNIPAGAFVASVTNGTTFVLNVNATAAATGQSLTASQGGTTSGEGLLYVAPGATATLKGDIIAGSFTKSGAGTVVFGGSSNGILGSLTIQEGVMQVAPGAHFARLQTDLVLNNQGVLDLNGNNAGFSSLSNSNGLGGGLITNNGSSPASFILSAVSPQSAGPVDRLGTVGQNNQTITGLTSTADLMVGMPVTGTNVAAGAVIRSIDSATQISISAPGNNANVTAAVQTITFGSLFSGQITDGTSALTLVKNGAGTTALGAGSVMYPDAGNNTFTGGTVVNQGTLLVENPLALGGYNGSTPGDVTLVSGTLDLRSNGGGIQGTIILGNQSTNGVNMNIQGPATINVDRLNSTVNMGNDWQINNLTLTENTLTMTGANSYGFHVAGTTTIAGSYATIFSNSDQANGNIEFDGVITGPGAFNKQGGAIQRVATIAGTANTYTGGTNIMSGSLQVTATSGTPLGTGRVNVMPGAMLRLGGLSPSWAAGTIGGAPLVVNGYYNSVGVVSLDTEFNPAPLLNATNFGNAYGTTALALSKPVFAGALDMSTIGDGKALLISGITTEVDFIGTLAPGASDGLAPRVYRLAGGVNNLALTGPDNQLNDNSAVGTSLQVGLRSSVEINGAATNTGNGIIIRNSNSFTGGTYIGKGSAITLDVGGSPAGSTPLGSSNGTLTGAPTDVIIYGTLQLGSRADSSYVNAATGKNANNYILRPGGVIVVTDFAGSSSGGQERWADTDANGGGLALNGGTFQYNAAAATASSETVGTFTVGKDSRIIINRNADASTSALIVNDLTRVDHGTLILEPRQGNTVTAGILGLPLQATTQLQQGSGFDRLLVSNPSSAAIVLGGTTSMGAGVTKTGMAPGWIIDAATNSFVTYNPSGTGTGYQPLVTNGSTGSTLTGLMLTPGPGQAGYSKVVTSASAIPAGSFTANDIVDINTTGTVTLGDANTTIYALRTNRDVNPTPTNNTLTLTGGALIATGNNLTFNNTPNPANAAPQPFTLNFGTNGSLEALIYANVNITINGQINAAGLTHFAPVGNGGVLTLTGDNNITGPIYLNQGVTTAQNTISGTGETVTGVFNNQDVYLGGAGNRDADRLILDARVGNTVTSVLASGSQASSHFGGTIFINGESRLDDNSTLTQHINNLTFADLGAGSPISLTLGSGVYVDNTTTLGAHDNILDSYFNQAASSVLGGKVQGGTLIKYDNGTLLLAGSANTYAATVINEGGTNTASSILGSLTRTGTPFGTGSITINPGGMLRIADASNIASNVVTMNSDGEGLAGIAIAYNSATPLTSLFGTGAGKIQATSTGDFMGVIALDINSYINPINMAALETAAGGKLWLGSSIPATYFGSSLTPASDNVYRLGGGGNQGSLTIGGGSFENVLTGSASVQIGAETAGFNANGNAYINGNFGTLTLTNRNDFTGGIQVNGQANLGISNAYALGSGTLSINGGSLVFNNTVSVPNNVNVVADVFGITGGGNGALNGPVNLSPSGVGGSVTLNAIGGGVVGFQGVISGAQGSNLIKSGATGSGQAGQTVVFNGVNTYHGTTTILSGFLGVGTDVFANVAGALGINDVPVILGNPAANNQAGSLLLAGQITFDRSLIAQGGNGSGLNTLRGQTLNNSVFSGGIAVTAGSLAIDQISTSDATFRGGVLDIQGPISGTGALIIGFTGNSTSNVNQGIIRLSANANGYGTSTISGGVTLQGARLQVNADTYYTGPANNPTIISGPLGTGTFTFGSGNNNAGGEIVAFGGDRTIVNPLGALSTAADTTLTFGGHNDLTFTRDFNINSDTTFRNRTFNAIATQGDISFSGIISTSGTAGGKLTKTGAGTLDLSGVNTFFPTGAGNSQLVVSAGVLQFHQDANLGRISTTATSITINGPAAMVLLGTTPVTWSTTGSNHVLALAAAAYLDVDDPGGLWTINTGVTGAFGLTKEGAGTLALNSGTNAMSSLTIGGAILSATANLTSGNAGGIVSTTATSGTPFSNNVTINDGRLSLVGGSTAQALTITSVTYAGGSSIQLDHGTTTTKLTATALTRSLQGTVDLLPTSLANLGTTEQLLTSTAYPNTGGILSTPALIVRDPASGDLNFVQYVAGSGFTLNSATTTTSLAVSAPTSLADLSAVTSVGSGAVNILAVRSSANITPTDATSLLQINNGGLILNGAAGPNVSVNTYFGNGTTPQEALVFVRGGQSSASVLSGNFTATNFTKAGLGTLLIFGTSNVMAPSVSALNTLMINDGIVSFASQASVPSNGLINISPMDGAQLDLAGQNLSFASLGGQTSAAAATGIVSNSGALATLTINARTGVTSNFNGLITGNVSLVKRGVGTLILGYNDDYTGGTTIGVGNITSALGVITPVGTLQVNSYNSLGTGPVNLAGGILDIRNPVAPNEVQDAIDVIAFGPNAGYNIIVKGLNNFGSANVTSTVNTTNTVAVQAVSTLTFESNADNLYFLTTGGATDNNLLVRGLTTLAGDTTFNNVRNLVLGGMIAGTGDTITKIGADSLILTNTDRVNANSVGRWNVYAGNLEVRMSQGGSNPLSNGATVQLSTSGQLTVRHDGDNLADPQVLSDFSSNTLQIGSLQPVTSDPTATGSYTSSPNTIINLGTNSSAADKTIQFNRLDFGGPLGTNFLSLNLAADNKYTLDFANGLTMVKDAYLSLNNNGGSLANVTLDGQISGNGTLYKQGGGELDINAVATNTGGTVLSAGDTFFGSFLGQTRTLSLTAKLAPGGIAIEPGARLRFNAISNLNGSQLVEVRSNLNNLGVVGIGDDTVITAYNLRAPFASGAFSNNTSYGASTGGGVLALNSLYDASVINLSRIGDGTWFLGSTSNGSGLTVSSSLDGRYNSAQLLPGAPYEGIGNNNPTYRLGGGAGNLYIGTSQTGSAGNQLFGNANVVVGAPLTSGFAGTVGNGATAQNATGSAGVIFAQDQSYTGATLVNRGSQMEFRGAMATASYDVYGILVAGGSKGSFVGGPTPTIWQGGEVNLDNQFDLLPANNTQGRWGDTTPVVLNSGTFRVIGNSAADLTETVGPVSAAGGSFFSPQRTFVGRVMEIDTPSISRMTNVGGITGNNGQLSIEPTSSSYLGTDERVVITNPANIPAITNGMVAPWMYNNRDSQFITYSDFGFVNAGFTVSASGALTAASSTLNDRTFISGASTLAAGAQLNAYALRVDGNITLGTATDTTAKITIASGGLISNGAVTVTPALVFGSAASPGEAIIANNNNLIIGLNANPTTSGQVTASSITKSGTGNMFMDAEQQTFAGNIIVNGGGFYLRSVGTGSGGSNSTVGGLGGTIVVNGFNSTIGFRSDPTFTSTLTATAVSGATATLPNVTGLAVGMVVTGTGTTSGVSYITAINGTTVTVSNATFSGTPALTFTPLGTTFDNSIYIAPGNALIGINVDRVNSTSLTGKTNSISGDLIFGGAPGDQGQTVNFNYSTGSVNYSFMVDGKTDLGPAGNAVLYMNSSSGNVTLAGDVIGSGTLVKEGSATLFLGLAGAVATSPNTYTGGTVLQNGTIQATSGQQLDANGSIVNSALGTGDITLETGTLNLRVEGANTTTNRVYTFSDIANLNVLGSTTISVDRVDSLGGTTKTVAFNQLNIGGQVLTVSTGNTWSLRFNNVLLSGTPSFQANQDLILANVSDAGGGLFIAKNGGGTLWMDGNGSTYSGGTFINQGVLRFGNPGGASTTAQAGPGNITINPSGQVILESLANINTAAGQMIDVRSLPDSLGIVRLQTVVDPTPLITSTSTGMLMIPTSYSLPINMVEIGNGTFQLTMSGANTYSAPSLGVGAGNVYRLGGNSQNFTITAANNNVLTGSASLQIGSLASTGGSFVFNNTNDYTGGTTVARGITAQWFTSNVGANNLNTPLGTGAVESFGQTIAYGSSGNYNQNTFNFHPGATIRIDSNATLTAITASSSTGSTATLPNVNGLAVGMSVTGTGTVTGSVITAINGNVITVSGATFTGAPALTFSSNDRWADSTPLNLNGVTLSYNGMNNQVSTELYGAATFAAGSRVALTSNGTGQVQLSVPTLVRTGNATMVFTTGAANRLGLPAGSNSERFVINSGAPALAGTVISGTGAPTGVAPAWFVDGTAVSFVSYDPTAGFRTLLSTASPAANQVAYSRIIPAGTFPTGLNGTDTVDVTGAVTLLDNPSMYDMRTNSTINNGFGQFNTIVLSNSGPGGGLIVTNAAVSINPNLSFGSSGQYEGVIYVAGNTTQLNGDVNANGITKFGAGVLQINQDQTDLARGPGVGYNSGWTVNEGQLTANTFGALGNAVASNTVTLNGSVNGAATLRLQANSGNSLNQIYTFGRLIAVDNAAISWAPGGDDRVQSIGDVQITSTGGTAMDAQLLVNITNTSTNGTQARSILQAGQLYISGTNAGALLNVGLQSSNLTTGTSTGFSIAGINGTSDQHLDKWGAGVLYVRGASNFSGAVNIQQGALQIDNLNSLGDGSATNVVTVQRFGALDINVAGFNRTDVIFQPGSMLRLTATNAIAAPAFNLGAGTLQVGNDELTMVTAFTLNGGSIEGFLRTDDLLGATQAVYRTLGAGVTFNLAGDSFLGQNQTQGVNGLDDGRQANTSAPLSNSAAGVLLEIQGVISGPGGLTKQGNDMITLSGANTYTGGTTVQDGTLRIGRTNALLAGSNLTTMSDAVFDLNGFDQTIGTLSSPKVTTGAAGYITNTAFGLNTLTVGNAANSSYSGVIQYNVALTKTGTGVLQLTNNNTFNGPTIVNLGTLEITHSTGTVADGLSGTSSLTVAGGATFNLRPGTGAGVMTLPGTSGTVLTLGNGSTIGVEVGGGGGSHIVLNPGAKALVSGTVKVNVYGTSTGSTPSSIVLSSPSGGLLNTNGSAGSYVLGKVYNNTDFTVSGITQSDTLVQLSTTPATPLTAAYWKGGLSGTGTDEWAVSNGAQSNWATDLAGTATGLVPGAGTDVFVSATTHTNESSMQLGADMSINSLTFNSTSGPVVNLQDPGGHTLTIGSATPITSATGAGSATIGVNLVFTAATATVEVDSSNPLRLNGVISGGALTKIGTGTLVLGGKNIYTGATLIQDGTLQAALNNTLPVTGDLNFSSSSSLAPNTTVGALDLSTNGVTVNNLNVFSNSSTLVNRITIGAGQTLQVTGAVTVGPNSATINTSTKLTLTGAGSFMVGTPSVPTATNFKVGGASQNALGNSAVLDMSGLSTFYANLGSGSFTVGDLVDGAGSGTGNSTLNLAVNSTIIASTFSSDSPHGTQTITLGSGTNIIDANTVNIGAFNNRASGTLGYLGSTGTLQIRALDGMSRATMNVAYGPTGTGAAPVVTVDLTGHQADLLLSTLNIGGRTATSAGASTGTFKFDTGTLDVTGVTVGDRRATTGTGAVTGTLQIGGGNVTIGTGGLTIATNTSTAAGNTATGTVNISGGTVTVGATLGVSITLGRSTTSGIVATPTLNLTGGTVTLAGNIVEATGSGNAAINSTLTLNGATLDMAGNKIGTATEPVNTLNFQSGTLNSLASINGTAGLTKTTTGVLTLTGTNGWTGATTVSQGRLQVGNGVSGSITGTGNVVVSGAGTTLATASVLAGGSPTSTVAGTVTVGTLTNPGILAPGVGNSATDNQSLVFTSAGGVTVADHSQLQMSITTPTVNAANPAVTAFLASGQDLGDYLAAHAGASSAFDITPTYGSEDYINITNGGLSLGTRATGTLGNGSLVIQSNGYAAPAAGDVFNLFDWTTLMTGNFSVPGANTTGGVYGDIDLPTLSGNLQWDLSALSSHGLIGVTTVVPEPGRVLLLLLGLLGICLRRRRSV